MEAVRAFGAARFAQGMTKAEAAQAYTVQALSAPNARYLFFALFYVCWQLLKLTLLRRVLPALGRCLRRVPRLHVPLTADEADAAPKGAKWVRARTQIAGRPAPPTPVARRCGCERGRTGHVTRRVRRSCSHRPSLSGGSRLAQGAFAASSSCVC